MHIYKEKFSGDDEDDVVEVFLITTLLIQVMQLLTCFIRNDS
jgi:hypothetical protein